MANQAKAVLQTETLEAVADRGYFSSLEILACHDAGITVTLPKPRRRVPGQMAASASRTLSICQKRTPIAVPLGSNCHIASRARKTASGYGAKPVKIVRLNRSARQGQSGGPISDIRWLNAGGCGAFTRHPFDRATIRYDEVFHRQFCGGHPRLAIDSLVRREARPPHLRIDVEGYFRWQRRWARWCLRKVG
jgi:hypothetical protein